MGLCQLSEEPLGSTQDGFLYQLCNYKLLKKHSVRWN